MVVYKITNLLNMKPYVGQTRQSIEKRFLQHSKADSPLGNDMRNYGLENFTIEVIERCNTQAELDAREKFWIRALNCMVPNGYNRTLGGERRHGKQLVNAEDTAIKTEISEALQRFRKLQNMTQRQLATQIGVPYQSYQTYEYGTSVPGAKVIIKMATAFNVSADYLLGLSDEPRPPDVATLVAAISSCQEILSNALENRSE